MNLVPLNLLGHGFRITWNRWQIHEMATPINARACEIQKKNVTYANQEIFETLKNAYANPTQSLRQPGKTKPKTTSSSSCR